MPTLLRLNGFRFYFYSHEPNEPPHVHVDKSGCSAKVWLSPIALAKNHGFRAKDLTQLLKMVEDHSDSFEAAWYEYFNE